jgi:hypothetical protein
MTDFTLEQAREAWLEVVAERGKDFEYHAGEGCWYGPYYPTDGDYSCAIGGIISKLAPEVFEKFKEFERNNKCSFMIRQLLSVRWAKQDIRDTLNVDPETLDYLALIQSEQDNEQRYDVILPKSEKRYQHLLEG